MAASTGPDSNLYQIPEVELGDTFNVWRDTTNTQTYKLNKMKVYDGVSSSSITLTLATGGTLTAELADNIGKGVTFLNPVVFSSGVTFNGDVTFNASTFTVNANAVTIDDYAIVLGDTAAASDSNIGTAGGGGVYINRGGGATAEWIWKPNFVYGVTGVWQANAHIGFSGATSGLYPHLGGTLPVHGTGVLLDGGATGEHGLLVNLTSTGVSGVTSNRVIQFSRYSPSGSTAFIEVFSGSTYGSRPFVSIKDGVNRKIVSKPSHGFAFGTPVRFDGSTYVGAIASDGQAAEVIGIVSSVMDANTFELTFNGEIFGDFTTVNGGSALNPGSTYYLSTYTTGRVTPIQPTASGSVHKALFIATSSTSAVVIPFTGGVLTSPLTLATSTSVGIPITQANGFTLGDILRFKAYSPGVTLEYIWNAAGNTYAEYHDHGIYVKAQADSVEEAEVVGMVIGFDGFGLTGDVGYQTKTGFNLLMDGFFDLSTSSIGALTPGSVYYLNSGCAGTTGSFESAAVSYSTSTPTVGGQVRKPAFMATAPKAGYLFSYRGDIRAETAIEGTSADVTRLLVSDIRDGFSGDLKIGVYNGSNNGREAIRIAAGSVNFNETRGATAGYVGIGNSSSWSQWNSGTNTQNRIMTELDVDGTIRLGKTFGGTPVGQDLLVVRNTGDAVSGTTMESRFVIGTDWSNANLVLGRGVRPNRSGAGFISSLAGSQNRAALVLGISGGDGTVLRWGQISSSSAELGSSVALTDVFSVVGKTMRMHGTVSVSDTGAYPTSSGSLAYNRVHIGGTGPLLTIWNDGAAISTDGSGRYPYSRIGLGSRYAVGDSYLAGGYIDGGIEGTTDKSGYLALFTTPADGSSSVERMRITSTGSVGIGTTTPGATLDVNGTLKVGNFGGATNVMAKATNSVGIGRVVPLFTWTSLYSTSFQTMTQTTPLPTGTWFVHLVGYADDTASENPSLVMAKVWTVPTGQWLSFATGSASFNTVTSAAISGFWSKYYTTLGSAKTTDVGNASITTANGWVQHTEDGGNAVSLTGQDSEISNNVQGIVYNNKWRVPAMLTGYAIRIA